MRNLLSSYVTKYCLWYSFWEQRNSRNAYIGSGEVCICLKHYKGVFGCSKVLLDSLPKACKKTKPKQNKTKQQKNQVLSTRGGKELKENNSEIIMPWHYTPWSFRELCIRVSYKLSSYLPGHSNSHAKGTLASKLREREFSCSNGRRPDSLLITSMLLLKLAKRRAARSSQ